MDGRGIKDLHKCGEEMCKNSSLPSQEQQETSDLNGLGGRRVKKIKGPRPFVPVGDTNRDKRGCLLSRLVAPTGTKGCVGLLSRLVPPTGIKGPCRPHPPLARLAVGPGTKATYCPGPKGYRDKWPGTKAYSVEVEQVWNNLYAGYIQRSGSTLILAPLFEDEQRTKCGGVIDGP